MDEWKRFTNALWCEQVLDLIVHVQRTITVELFVHSLAHSLNININRWSDFLPIKSIHMVAIAPGLRLQISLVVVLSGPVLGCSENMRTHEMVFKFLYFTCRYFILNFLLYFFCNFHLFLIVAENGWGVLCALVIHLPVLLRRVVEGEEEFNQLLKAHFRVVEQNMHHFYVACVPLAHFLVRRVLICVGLRIHEANRCTNNAIWVIFGKVLCKKLFDSPEASCTEGGQHQILMLTDDRGPLVNIYIGLAALPLFHHVLSVQLLQDVLHHLVVHFELFLLILHIQLLFADLESCYPYFTFWYY